MVANLRFGSWCAFRCFCDNIEVILQVKLVRKNCIYLQAWYLHHLPLPLLPHRRLPCNCSPAVGLELHFVCGLAIVLSAPRRRDHRSRPLLRPWFLNFNSTGKYCRKLYQRGSRSKVARMGTGFVLFAAVCIWTVSELSRAKEYTEYLGFWCNAEYRVAHRW
jgi:hypothetical protein